MQNVRFANVNYHFILKRVVVHHKTKGKTLKKLSCVLQVYLSGVVVYLQGIIPWATNWLMGLLNINLTLRAEKKNKK